jgi:AAA domain
MKPRTFKHPPLQNDETQAQGQKVNAPARTPSGDEKIYLPPFRTFTEILATNIVRPPELIAGILHQGLKMEIAGASKTMKSWLQLQTSLCIANGIDWFGHSTKRVNCVYLNLEIPDWAFNERVQLLGRALGLNANSTGNLQIWNLRGIDLSPDKNWNIATDQIAALPDLGFITIDPLYKLFGEKQEENSTAACNTVMRRFDQLAERTGAATNCALHFTKGDPTKKNSEDRFSGSGVLVRDPDVYISSTKHKEKDCLSLEFTIRCGPPVEPFVIQWQYPRFKLEPDLDPTELYVRPSATEQKKKSFETKYNVKQLVEILGNEEFATGVFRRKVMDETGMSKDSFFRLLKEAEVQKLIARDGQTQTWERVQRNKATQETQTSDSPIR